MWSDQLMMCSENGISWLIGSFDYLRRKCWNPCVLLCCYKMLFKFLNPFSDLSTWQYSLLNFYLVTEDMHRVSRLTVGINSQSLTHNARCWGLLLLVVYTWGYVKVSRRLFLCPISHPGCSPEGGKQWRKSGILLKSERMSYSLLHLQCLVLFMLHWL